MDNTEIISPSPRLQSLDFFRGLIMALLALEGAWLYEHLRTDSDNLLLLQFFHHPWNGLRFWDLIQPGFMFIAGVGMALSLSKNYQAGQSWSTSFRKMAIRCAWLFFWGVLNYAVRPEGLSFELWNVLTQLSFTLMIAFLIFDWTAKAQIGFSLLLLIITEFLYRFTSVEGFDQPFTNQHNFGNFMDIVLMGKVNTDGWVAINFLPTAAHTIWGAVAGKMILSNSPSNLKIKNLLLAGAVGLIIGYGLDLTITPIIKRTATSSFVLASGGWCLLMFALCYWWIDIRNHKKHLLFFTVIGMNSIFIYLFFEIVGARWFNGYVGAFTMPVFLGMTMSEGAAAVLTSLVIFSLEWGMCYFLYRKKIFFRV